MLQTQKNGEGHKLKGLACITCGQQLADGAAHRGHSQGVHVLNLDPISMFTD